MKGFKWCLSGCGKCVERDWNISKNKGFKWKCQRCGRQFLKEELLRVNNF